jgi:hypothetical protein
MDLLLDERRRLYVPEPLITREGAKTGRAHPITRIGIVDGRNGKTAEEQMRGLERLWDFLADAYRCRALLPPISGGSSTTGTWKELLYINTASGTARNTFTAEGLQNDTAGMGAQAKLDPYFYQPVYGVGKTIEIEGYGILSTTVSPTFTWTIRLGASGTAGPIVLGSAALTAGATVTNQIWRGGGRVVCRTTGAAGANSTFQGLGLVEGGTSLASPFAGALFGGAASPGTVATVDISITNFINYNCACGTSSASNIMQLLQLAVYGVN